MCPAVFLWLELAAMECLFPGRLLGERGDTLRGVPAMSQTQEHKKHGRVLETQRLFENQLGREGDVLSNASETS